MKPLAKTKRGYSLCDELGLPIEYAGRCSAIMRAATAYARWQVRLCNEGETPEYVKWERSLRHAIDTHVNSLPPDKISKVVFGGDPRGYTVHLMRVDGRYNTWGGAESGWGIA